MKPLVTIPIFLTQGPDLEVLMTCLETLRRTARDEVDVLLVDDGSPDQDLVNALENVSTRLEFELHRKVENTGFAKTVNVGLRRSLQQGRDAILCNADIEFIGTAEGEPSWVERFQGQSREDDEDQPASVVGARLIYPNGLIQHGGVYFSLLHRCFEHIHKYAPYNLPEAMVAKTGPVTGALQFIRLECLQNVGIYDEHFTLGWEDVDYCIRVWLSGRSSVYQPNVRAYHHESFFRSRPSPKVAAWTQESWAYFARKYASQSFAEFIPSLIA